VTGHFTGSKSISGLVVNGGIIENCFSQSNISGINGTTAGLLIDVDDSNVIIRNCYYAGTITGQSRYGLLRNKGGCTVQDCYWDTQVSGVSTSGAGTGKTSSEMKSQSTYTNWDFTNIWNITNLVNGGYPYLKDSSF
jgi:hypothetical protein